MPEWVRGHLAAEADADRILDEQADLVMIAQVNREFGLREPLHRTAARAWHDILAWNMALHAERQLEARARRESGRGH